MDSVYVRELWRRNGVKAREGGGRKKERKRASSYFMLLSSFRKADKRGEIVSEIGFLALTCLLIAAAVSAPATGAKPRRSLF